MGERRCGALSIAELQNVPEIIEDILQNDGRGAFRAWYEAREDLFLSIAMRISRRITFEIARDIVQDSIFKVIRFVKNGGHITGVLTSYVHTTIRNTALAFLGLKSNRVTYIGVDDLQTDQDCRNPEDIAEIRGLLAWAIKGINEREAEIMRLSFVEGLQQKQIADRMGLGLSQVKMIVSRMRQRLKELRQQL
jgi:RNA polymerase sigma factor (sigma-70 family)